MGTFTATLLGGHKDAALEVPFDPEQQWGLPPERLWHGRRGFRVAGRLNDRAIESVIVPRARRFWLLVDAGMQHTLDVAIGDEVRVSVRPA
ncbi:MAG TPA: DUF1905 domain-containing protein [Candidatus Kapabacteria bacterium]|nr:DUF1905 domain-containing protein [Candidatus Kapabacteria bacterium]